MQRERWFRGGFDGRERPFDWLTPARQHGISDQDARALYEQAVRQASAYREPGRHEQAIYLALLATARPQATRPTPGKVTRTMRVQARRAGIAQRRPRASITGQPIAPCKTTLTSYLEAPDGPARSLDRSPRATGPALLHELLGVAASPGNAGDMRHAQLRTSQPDKDLDQRTHTALAAAFGDFEAIEALAAEAAPEMDAPARDLAADQDLDRARHLAERLAHLASAPRLAPRDLVLLLTAVEPALAQSALRRLRDDHAPGRAAEGSIQAATAARTSRMAPVAGDAWRQRTAIRPLPLAGPGSRAPAPALQRQTVALDRLSGARQAEPELQQDLVQHVLAGLDTGTGQPLPPGLAQRMARLLGHDFDHVRVHTDDRAAEAAALLGARAFTMGAHIYMGRGQWAPGKLSFERLLVHELTHVVQHDQGRLAPGPGDRVRVATPGEASEREAEAAAAQLGDASQATPHATDGAMGAAQAPGASATSQAAGGRAGSAGPDTRTGTAPRAAGGQAEGDVASPGLLPSLSDIVRLVSPGLADLIDEGPLGVIQGLIEGGIETFLSPFTSTIESIGGTIDGLVDSFGEVLGFIDGLFAGDPKCCQAFIDGIDRIRSIAQGIAENPAVQALQAGLGQVTSAIQEIATLVLSPVFDVVKGLLGGAWEGISGLASTISGWLQPILDFSSDAWSWAMEQLGIGGAGGEGGILDWLTGVASDAWSTIAETLGPVAGPLKTVAGVLLALSPVGPVMLLIQYGPDLVRAVQWLWQNRNDPDIVKRAHAEMGNTILPGVLDAAQGFGQAMQSAATWLVEQATGLSTGLLELAGALTGVPLLGLVQGAVQSFSEGATRFAQWATGAFSGAVEGLQEGFAALQDFVAPYADVLCSVGLAIVNPGMIPMILAGHAWMALPDCIKGPIIDLLLDAAIAVLDALPSLPLFGPLWAILKSGVLGFLRGLRAQPTEVKEKVSNKIARIISGSSPAFLLGFVQGFLTGVWEGLTDPFVLIWSAVQGLGSLVSWFGDMAQQALSQTATRAAPANQGSAPAASPQRAATPPAAPAASPQRAATPPAAPTQDAGLPTRGELGERVGQMGAELGPPVEQVTGGFWPAVNALFQGGEGLTLEGLIARLGDVWAAIDQSIQGASASLAGRVCEFFMGDQAEGELGKAVGWLAGTIAFEVLLGVLTAGAWQPVSAVGKALKAFARILDWTGEALGAAFRLLGRIGGLVIEALQGLRRMLASAGGAVAVVLDGLGEIGQKLLGFADELLARFGRGVASEGAEEAAEEIAEEAAEQTGKEVAEEAAEQTGKETAEEAAEETAEEAAEETAEEAAEETAEEAAEETAEEAGEEAGEQGGKRSDETPDMTEKLRVAAEAKIQADLMQAAGTPGVAVVRALKAMFQPRYRWIKDFRVVHQGAVRYRIYMIASEVFVDDGTEPIEPMGGESALEHQERILRRGPEETVEQYQQRLLQLRASLEPRATDSDEMLELWDALERRMDELNLRAAKQEAIAGAEEAGLRTLAERRQAWDSVVLAGGQKMNWARIDNARTLPEIDDAKKYLEEIRQQIAGSRRAGHEQRALLSDIEEHLRKLDHRAERLRAAQRAASHGHSDAKLLDDILASKKTNVWARDKAQAQRISNELEARLRREGKFDHTEFHGPESHRGSNTGVAGHPNTAPDDVHFNVKGELDGKPFDAHVYFPPE